MKTVTQKFSFKNIFSALRKNEEGVVVTELALSVPLLLIILSGIVEVSNFLLVNMKAQHTVVSIGDLTTRSSTLSADTVADVYTAIEEIMAPYPVNENTRIIISALSLPASPQPNTPPDVIWQCTNPNSTVPVSSKFGPAGPNATFNDETITMREGETLVVSEFFYQYQPLVFSGSFFDNMFNAKLLRKRAYFRPRIGALQTIEPALTPEGANSGCALKP